MQGLDNLFRNFSQFHKQIFLPIQHPRLTTLIKGVRASDNSQRYIYLNVKGAEKSYDTPTLNKYKKKDGF